MKEIKAIPEIKETKVIREIKEIKEMLVQMEILYIHLLQANQYQTMIILV